MKQILASVFALVFSFGVFIEDAEAAKRLGGGGNVGAQRSITSTPKQATPPTQQQAAPAAAGKAAPAAAPAGNRWLGPLAGLAAGVGLGYLFSQGGLGGLGGMMSALLMGLVAVVVVVMLMRFFGRRNTAQQPMQYAGMGQQPVAIPPSATTPFEAQRAEAPAQAFGSAATVAAVNVPAGFDVEGFLKQGKRNFLMLQQANSAGDLALIKDVTTVEMFEALRPQINERVASGDSLDVSNLEASLLEVTTESEYHWASIRFHGMMQEGPGATPAPFEEVWNLRKSVAGNGGWLLAGIQQVS